eukprot:tig00000430_g636.t1
MGRTTFVHNTSDKPVEIKKSAEDVLKLLMRVEEIAKCYPDCETIEKTGNDEFCWTMTEKQVSTIKMRLVHKCKYSRSGNSIEWGPSSEDQQHISTGKFTVADAGDGKCKLTVECKLDTEIPIPSMLMGFARKLGEREMKKTWNAYVEAIKKGAEEGKFQKGELDYTDPLGDILEQRNDPSAREKNYLDVVRAYYDAVTDLYQTGWGSHFHFGVFYDEKESAEVAIKRLETMVIKAGNINEKCFVLDVGCGVGGPTCNIALNTGCKIIGLNINQKQIERGRERAKELCVDHLVSFDNADAMKMPYADATFDVITFFESVCHMPDKKAFFRECFRVLKPGGRISGTDWMQCDNPDEEEVRRYVEPICSAHAVPHMGSVLSYATDLAEAGFMVSTAIDLRAEGDILRNWEMLDEAMIKSYKERPKELYDKNSDPLMDMLLTGGVGLSEGAKAGVFILGRFLAHKPTSERRWDPPASYGRFPDAGLGIKEVPLPGKSTVAVDSVLKDRAVQRISDVAAPNAKSDSEGEPTSKKRKAAAGASPAKQAKK